MRYKFYKSMSSTRISKSCVPVYDEFHPDPFDSPHHDSFYCT